MKGVMHYVILKRESSVSVLINIKTGIVTGSTP